MRKPLLFVLTGVLLAATVSAVDLTDNLGIGFDAINDTVTVRWVGDGIGVEGRLAVAASIRAVATSVTMRPGAAVVLPFQLTADANLNVIDALDFVADLQNIGATPANTFNLIVGGGLAPEIFLTPRLSVETMLAVQVALNDLAGTPVTEIAVLGQRVSLNGELTFGEEDLGRDPDREREIEAGGEIRILGDIVDGDGEAREAEQAGLVAFLKWCDRLHPRSEAGVDEQRVGWGQSYEPPDRAASRPNRGDGNQRMDPASSGAL